MHLNDGGIKGAKIERSKQISVYRTPLLSNSQPITRAFLFLIVGFKYSLCILGSAAMLSSTEQKNCPCKAEIARQTMERCHLPVLHRKHRFVRAILVNSLP